MTLAVRAARTSDALELAPRLRAADRRELAAAVGGDAADVLARGIAEADEAFAVVDPEGAVVALFGVRADPKRDDAGRPWLLASDALVHHPVAFVRASRLWIERMHRRHRILWNQVDARNALHIAWLERCGFRRVKTLEGYGPEKRTFLQYARVRGER